MTIFVEALIVGGGNLDNAVAEARALADRMGVVVRLRFCSAFGDIDPGDPRSNAAIVNMILGANARAMRAQSHGR